ncbi:lasso peptide biosynthesis B2 protein [Croceicoccus sp. YJ47]|uniref:lasso peptide biosynthesis B2 protein n=1 Tax=Croceicoccus sp. YJ47 TaxID=2798724 RepID=UPI0019208DD1|nr:lasso peptide biosynthesis B2 protein [Croceicoccus sp. YJ47]QQN72905.1 lasso peptide biosynthesis B2 protein [Croceicoccus sp. YJ47]
MIRHRLRVAEAIALLAAARLFIGLVPFANWKTMLGTPVAHDREVARPARSDADERMHGCRTAIRRGARYVPGAICLPQAMALQWMLSRRKLPSVLTIGFLPGAAVDTEDRLHAWIRSWRGIEIGDSGKRHVPLISMASRIGTGISGR